MPAKGAVELQPDIASWPPMSLTPVRGTVLGAADFTVFNGDNDRFAVRGVGRLRQDSEDAIQADADARPDGRDSLERRHPAADSRPALEKRPARIPPICQCD
jgi:hypothetical protein